MIFDLSEGSVDKLVFEMWRDLPNLTDEMIAQKVSGREGVLFRRPFTTKGPACFMDWEESFGNYPSHLGSFLFLGIENIIQHVMKRTLFISSVDETSIRKSLILADSYQGRVSVYILDSGPGFVDSEGRVVLKEAFLSGKRIGSHGENGLGFSWLIADAPEMYAFSMGQAIHKPRGGNLDDVKQIEYPFGGVVPKGALICGRFYR
ncbi:hypothetical protein HOC01_05725 [archaeon]|jgi:hypothetical protein|nr:hypothetical protein [archaeon]MBT6697660.1 hypothetical protein [archaeon]